MAVDPLDSSRPSSSDLVRNLAEELRAIKGRLITDKDGIAANVTAIEAINTAIDDLAAAIASGTRYVVLTSTAEATWQVPPGVTKINVMAIGGGQGGMGGFGVVRGSQLNSAYYTPENRGYAGQPGKCVFTELEVEAEEEITYQCGGAGTGGTAATGSFVVGGNYHGWNVVYRVPSNYQAQAGFVLNILDPDRLRTYFQLPGSGGVGNSGGPGGDSLFGIPANPSDDTLVVAAGGSYVEEGTDFRQVPVATQLGSYGMGGLGGLSAADSRGPGPLSTRSAEQGSDGEPGAILVMW